jgi:hypothetical protein
VAYFALLGYPPFVGATPEQILAKQTTDQAPVLREERDDVTPELARVLARGLRADPAARYASAAEYQQALREASRRTPLQRVLDVARRSAGRLLRGPSS